MADLFDQPITPPLRTVLAQVQTGKILIPEFQRPFVWKDQQRLDLIDSVSRGLPIGALMVWRTQKHELRHFESVGPFPIQVEPTTGTRTYLIDGHQRITTLLAALTPLPDGVAPDQEVRWPIYADLRDSPPTIGLTNRSNRLELVPTTMLLRNDLVFNHQKKLWEAGLDEEATRLEELANQFKDYPIPIIPLVSEQIGPVVNAFARVNRGGTSMSEAHLASALAYHKLPLRDALEAQQEEFEEVGWTLTQGSLLNALKLRFDLDVYRAPIPTLLHRLGADSGSDVQLRDAIKDSSKALHAAIGLLNYAGVMGSQALPYTYQLLVLAEALRRLDYGDQVPDAIAGCVYIWFWQSTLTEAFTGATGRVIRKSVMDLVAFLREERGVGHVAESVRNVERHTSWSSVRTKGRMLMLAQATKLAEPLKWLGRDGGRAVQRLHDRLPREEKSSWVVADRDTLRLARRAIEEREEPPLVIKKQLGAGAWEALISGDYEEFDLHQGEHIDALEMIIFQELRLQFDQPQWAS